MTNESSPGYSKLIPTIALFVLLGTPIVAFLWETLNRVMAARFDPLRIALSIPLLLLFVVLLRFMSRAVRRLEEERAG